MNAKAFKISIIVIPLKNRGKVRGAQAQCLSFESCCSLYISLRIWRESLVDLNLGIWSSTNLLNQSYSSPLQEVLVPSLLPFLMWIIWSFHWVEFGMLVIPISKPLSLIESNKVFHLRIRNIGRLKRDSKEDPLVFIMFLYNLKLSLIPIRRQNVSRDSWWYILQVIVLCVVYPPTIWVLNN